MAQIVAIKKKENSEVYDTEDIIRIFESSDDLNLLKSAVEKAKDRIYLSWASVEVKDKAGEIIKIDDIIEFEKVFIEERNGPIQDEHTNANVGQTLAFKVLEHPKSKTRGVLHLNKIYTHNKRDDLVWEEIVSGKKTGSSVGGIVAQAERYERDKDSDGGFVKVLQDFAHIETSAVENPCNPLALNEAFSLVAKSDTTARLDEKHQKNKMAKESQTKDSSDVIKTEDIIKRLEALEAKFDSIGKEEEVEEEEKEEETDRMSEVEDVLEAVLARMDTIEESMSGAAEDTEEVEESEEEPAEEEKEDEEATEEEEKEDEEEETEEKSLEAKVKAQEETIAELQKKLKGSKVIKSTKPRTTRKSEKQLTAYDIAMGRARYNAATESIVEKQ